MEEPTTNKALRSYGKDEHKIAAFFMETKQAFHFLEHLYSYQRLESSVKYPNEGRDATAVKRYVGASVGIEMQSVCIV
jgi:hypothetical protein